MTNNEESWLFDKHPGVAIAIIALSEVLIPCALAAGLAGLVIGVTDLVNALF